jgi:hypothetical protein
VLHAALCLFNHVLGLDNQAKKDYRELLEQSMKAIDGALNEKELID